MKKVIIFWIVVLGAISAFAQSRVFNSTDYDIIITSANNLQTVVVKAKKVAFVNFLPTNGLAEFKLGRYEGYQTKIIGNAKRMAKKGKITINDFTLVLPDEEVVEKKIDEKKVKDSVEKSSSFSAINTSNDSWWSKTEVIPKNESSVRILVLGAPFKGLALEANQASKKSIILKTGKYTFPVYYDPEPDSVSTGRKFRWAVVSKIVIEDQDTLRIRDFDLQAVSGGEQITKLVKNNLSINFLIINGPNSGKVIPANNAFKLELQIGWNIIPVQYLDENNLPVQAVLLLMANGLKKPLIADKKSDDNLISIKPDNLILTGH